MTNPKELLHLDRVRILIGERLKNGDKPFVIICAVGAGSNVIGEFVVLLESSGRVRVDSIQSEQFSSSEMVFEQLKAAVMSQFESRSLSPAPANDEIETTQKIEVSLVEQANAYLHLVELCSITSGRERLEFVYESTNSNQLKSLISCAIQDSCES